jgi:hypothetical protein
VRVHFVQTSNGQGVVNLSLKAAEGRLMNLVSVRYCWTRRSGTPRKGATWETRAGDRFLPCFEIEACYHLIPVSSAEGAMSSD